jgi:hypothetical protein
MGVRRDSEQHAQKPQPTAPDIGSPNSATGEPRRGPLTARSRLEIANRQLRTAADDMERFRQPIHRLRTLISAVDAAERELEVHRQAHLARQGTSATCVLRFPLP